MDQKNWTPNRATIIWEPSVSDPAHLIAVTFADGCSLSGSRWQMFLIKLLSKSILKTRANAIKRFGDNYKKAVIG